LEYSFLAEATPAKRKVRAKSVSKPPEQELGKQIPTGATLLSLASAEKILNAKYDGGYSLSTMKRLIRNGQWHFGWHWTRTGRFIKIYEPAIDEWQAEQQESGLQA
jgi:hypothetical protein